MPTARGENKTGPADAAVPASTSSSTDDLPPTASPPYRQVASTSNLDDVLTVPAHVYYEQQGYPPSPAYRSKSSVHLNMHGQEDADVKYQQQEKDSKTNAQTTVKPVVHYPDQPHPTGYQGPHYRPASPTNTATDDDHDDEDYDWSGEEDIAQQEAKFEERMGIKKKKKGWGFKRIVTLLFSSLIGSTFLAGVMVTPAILIHFYWYEKNPTEYRRYVKVNVQAWLFWAAANLLISWHLAVLVDLVPIVSTWIVSAVWGHVSEVIKSRVELYQSVKNTFKPVLYVASGWASWVIIFQNIFNLYDSDEPENSWASYTPRVAQAVQFLFFFGLVICAQKMLSHAIAFAFHRTAYRDRLETLGTSLKVIEKLRDYRPPYTYHTPGRSGGGGKSSGARTPLWGFSEKDRGGTDHYFSPKHGNKHSNGGTDGHDADTEDADRTLTNSRKGTEMTSSSKGKSRPPSWFGLGTGTSTPGPRGGSPTPYHTPATDERYMTGSPALGDGDHEMGVLRTNTSRPMSPTTPGSSSPHKYPPTQVQQTPSAQTQGAQKPSMQGSQDDGGDTLVQAAKALKSAVLHDARNIKGKEDGQGGLLGLGKGVGSSDEAKQLARSIYMKFRDRHSHRQYLLPSDFHPAFATPAEAEAAFRVFDKDNNGDISRGEIKTTVLKVYQERRSLARSMRDVGSALKTLDHILLFFALVVLFFISLSVFGVEVGDSLTSVYTIGIAASFIFKNAASKAFDAIMFLFVTHPFDTGDRCFVGEEVLTVKKMGLFATVFTRVDGTETYYFNSALFKQFITNIRRSGKMFENLTMQVAFRTPIEKLDALEGCMNEWLSTEENRWFDPHTSIVIQKIEFQRYIEITIGMLHNGTWQDWGLRYTRRTAFHAAVQHYCRQLGIVGYEAPLPVVWGSGDRLAIPPAPPSQRPAGGGDGAGPDAVPSFGGDADVEEELAQDEAAATGADQGRKSAMYFVPPEKHVRATVRARKTKSKKAVLRGTG